MTLGSWRVKAVGVLTALFALACGTPVQPQDYTGEPLATLEGQIFSKGQVSAANGVRLALAWYPSLAESQSAPKSILTQDMVYQGSFPMNYRFDITQPPPSEAMADMSELDGPKRVAMGFLLAYEDRNGNGVLDTIPADGTPIDRVLGMAVDEKDNSLFYLLYVEEEAGFGPEGDILELQPGFNLVKVGAEEKYGEIVPLSTPVPIVLEDSPLLDWWVCEAMFDEGRFSSNGEASPCGIPFEAEYTYFSGELRIVDDTAEIDIKIRKNEVPVPDAHVTIDGIAVPYDGIGQYRIEGAAGVLLRAGATHLVSLQVPGYEQALRHVRMPEDFSITSPAANATLTSGEPLAASWTASKDALFYVSLSSPTGDEDIIQRSFALDTLFTSREPIHYSGPATFKVNAALPSANFFGSVTRTVDVTFAP